jgi:acetate kinase
MRVAPACRWHPCEPMDTILVVNAGSASVKFQVFAAQSTGGLARRIKGQIDGIGTRPRLRASGRMACWRRHLAGSTHSCSLPA